MTTAAPFRDRLIPWYFVLFFLFVALVDGIMVTLALRGYGGTVTEHPYEKGLAYNEVVKAATAQKALGWQGGIKYSKGTLTLTLRDRDNHPVHLDHAASRFSRPLQAGMDFEAILHQASPGVWEAEARPPLPGLWEVRVYARQGDYRYQQSKRIIVE